MPPLTVAPIGLSSGTPLPNNGADFGPDTPGTTTSGIQEAINSLPACIVHNKSLGIAYTEVGQTGQLDLWQGVFQTSTSIITPPGSVTINGMGMSSWIPPNNIGAYDDLGGTQIVMSDYTNSAFSTPVDSHGFPATMLNLRNLDLRTVSPPSSQTTSTPAVLNLNGWKSGEMSNVNAVEVPMIAGTVGTNLYKIIDCSPGGSKDTTEIRNVRGFGGNIAVTLAGAHITAIGVTGGQTSGASIISNNRGLDIKQNLGCYFANLHAFSSKYGLGVNTYFGRPYTPLVIHGIMFEAVNHYLLNDVANMTGTVILENPCWNQPSLNPVTDIPATMPATTSVITSYEQDEGGGPYSSKHITVAPSSVTAGASPFAFIPLPYDQTLVITAVGGMTALTLDGQSLFNGSFTQEAQIQVPAGHTLIVTWVGTPPTFKLLPH